jgi:hypothetical protein
MGLPRTFVGFSSTDIRSYRLMCAWKEHEKIDFDFCDCQLQKELYSDSESYIKEKCRERINMAGTYVMLIGDDTRHKHKYVRWEAEIAIEKKCRLIGVNLDKWRFMNSTTCPPVMNDIGAVFVPFSPQIIAHALKHFDRKESGNWYFNDRTYAERGYTLQGNCAIKVPTTLLAEMIDKYKAYR